MKIKSRSIVGENLDGKILVMKEEVLDPKYRTVGHRLHKATGGFGCSPTAMGRAVFTRCLADDMDDRFQRGDFEGWLTEDEANALLVKERMGLSGRQL